MHAAPADEPAAAWCAGSDSFGGRRVVCADVAALDQILVYNRFGSFNPFGMMFALRRDLVPANDAPNPSMKDADAAEVCGSRTGTTTGIGGLEEGKVRLRDCKRPRPLTLRANVGDILHVRLGNYLRRPPQPDVSQTFCRQGGEPNGTWRRIVREAVSEGRETVAGLPPSTVPGLCDADTLSKPAEGAEPGAADWPRTRAVSFVIDGLRALPGPGRSAPERACVGTGAVPVGGTVDCFWAVDREGPFFVSSGAAPAGGEGDGGSLTHGLFGSLAVEPRDSRWYRGQVSQAAFDLAWARRADGGEAANPHARQGGLDYEARDPANGLPVLNLLAPLGGGRHEIVHNELNAIVTDPANGPFREFTVVFHDELKTFYTRNFEELGQFGQLAGVRDGFGINYGASGLGALILANRKGIGPAADCAECLYEEFFLESWANGDPALLEMFADDPSNVHHSYLNDRVVFRNYHAGPKETHVFHLHTHQWFNGNDGNRGSYLDSQTIGPRQGFTYNIYHGGLNRYAPGDPKADKGWWNTLGSGNRNRTVGDAIFHCHLYPHFAQGMWELWRVHDVLEDGSRRLPDGQATPGLSTELRPRDGSGLLSPVAVRPGSVPKATGGDRNEIGEFVARAAGTPIPAVVPLPGQAAPLLPTYGTTGMPGYPFYIAGAAGHRAPQAPLDIAAKAAPDGAPPPSPDAPKTWLDGGLPRHVVETGSVREFDVAPGAGEPVAVAEPAAGTPAPRAVEAALRRHTAKILALGNFAGHLVSARLNLLPYEGTGPEQRAMAFHHDGERPFAAGAPLALNLRRADGSSVETPAGAPGRAADGSYRSMTPDGRDAPFAVNGSSAKPGAPFADPCGGPRTARRVADPFDLFGGDFFGDPALRGFRRYEASAVQLDLVTNRAGWHDPQARINVLTRDSGRYKDSGPKAPWKTFAVSSAGESPFFFRAFSGECVEFRHTNELPKDLELDDFQVKTPTDTIGQHIHLVKFDVTSSDGSGNGWNYEDGTLAPDEIATRICAARTAGAPVVADRDGAPVLGGPADLCEPEAGNPQVLVPKVKDWWRRKREENEERFQTTVQRWFADPILSENGEGGLSDRTMRTVFTHDHFGPSSIQHHGFYSALVIEPAGSTVCGGLKSDADTCLEANGQTLTGSEGIGVHKRVFEAKAVDPYSPGAPNPPRDPLHPDYREFALAIADFALLYDPNDGGGGDDLKAAATHGEAAPLPQPAAGETLAPKGMATLVCEAQHRRSNGSAGAPSRLETWCASQIRRDESGKVVEAGENQPPAFAARNTITDGEVAALREEFLATRRMAGYGEGFGRPVNAPQRPEAISADHHDPYLVNYRGEPVPLRIGQTETGKLPFAASSGYPSSCLNGKAEAVLARAGLPLPNRLGADMTDAGMREMLDCSIKTQSAFPRGDLANVFRSALDPAAGAAVGTLAARNHGDPFTPILEAYDGERVQIRLIQGAQEVQHTMNVEGLLFRRHIDAKYPAGSRPLQSALPDETFQQQCLRLARDGRPGEHDRWRLGTLNLASDDTAFWSRYGAMVAKCENLEGFTAAQEVGISEHFEFGAVTVAEAVSQRVARIAGGAAAADGPDRAASPRATDYLYDFGSQDAIWNGAWGLLRVYYPDSPDYATCLAADPSAGLAGCATLVRDRLAKLPDENATPTEKRLGNGPDPATAQLSLQCPLADAGTPVLQAVAVAARVADLAAGHPRIFDPDALALVLLDPAGAAALDGPEFASPSSTGDKQALREAALAQARKSYLGEPFVLRANAGDCVQLTVVNALTASDAALPDEFGDARMPAIVPLNTDADWRTAEADGPVSADGEERMPVGANRVQTHRLAAPGAAGQPAGIRPSSRVGMVTPMSMFTQAQASPLPFGLNGTTTIEPGGRYEVEYYAGLQNLKAGDVEARLTNELPFTDCASRLPAGEFDALVGTDPQLTDVLGSLAVFPSPDPTGNGLLAFRVAGKRYEIRRSDPATNTDILFEGAGTGREVKPAVARLTEACIGSFLAGLPRSLIPYAFGAVPLKPFGDVFGQTAHGLVGTLLVGPQDAAAEGRDRDGALRQAREPAGGRNFRARPLRETGEGVRVRFPDMDGRERQRREFTLFYRDGLNLWDARSKDRWTQDDSGGGAIIRGPDGQPIRPMADCHICDDSYDWGEKAIGYRYAPFFARLRALGLDAGQPAGTVLESHSDLNPFAFPGNFLSRPVSGLDPTVLRAQPGEEVVIRVAHPGGRARQRAFVTTGNDYDDIFPGFGFPHSALVAPGKTVAAALSAPVKPGCHVLEDGPAFIRASGSWALLDVSATGESACGR